MDDLHGGLHFLPRAYSMDVDNDPRFSAPTVLSKRLGAFHMIAVASVLMLNLAIGQVFQLMPGMNMKTSGGIACIIGFCLMCSVFVANLCAVVIFSQQLYMTYRLETSGSSGFEMAKSFYLNPNVVTMRHWAAKCFLHYGIPVFVASISCLVFSNMMEHNNLRLAIPVCTLIFLATAMLTFMNNTHTSIFMEQYHAAVVAQAPMDDQMQSYSSRGRQGGWISSFLDV